MRRPSLT
jgi:coatomer subunit alpha